jgi:ketosteroid isomerase-like protein
MVNQTDSTNEINVTLDTWHKAAADANYNTYFNLMTDDAILLGLMQQKIGIKQHFRPMQNRILIKESVEFTALERHIYFDKTGKTAWFDELLNTQMKICRGSGVLVKIGQEWKIKQYVLSMTIPNDNSNKVIELKSASRVGYYR